MVFQKDTLLPWLTVAQNVALYFKFHPAPRAEVQQRVEWLLELAGLDGFERAYPYQLSGGMRRRVAFLAAVAPLPSLLLLDEPFSSLDEPTRVAIHQDVYAIVRRLGMTAVIVTHDLAEAISLCDEVVILTRRPGSVAVRHQVPFGNDRNMLELRQSTEFLALYGRVWHDLSEQLEPARGRQ
jgi:ABC-type nitrate/sulfonate/bicarbonate transport system ATPase subunit